ncbi:MAG: sulfate adenylyltransferase subunit CysN [Bacteroidia bacterium]|nr:sulfate adenylyltransferase subunit CysN [Bacteroidia bacterium]
MDLLRFTTAGSVDDGKSTLIGRLLYDAKSIFEDQLEAIKKSSELRGDSTVDLALLTDGLRAEREQGITIDVAYRYFSTPRRKFIIADTPGHIQYTRNMVTGASTADLSIVLVDARHGVVEQTKRHAFIASLLGIRHLILCINKMDLVDYAEEAYNRVQEDFSSFASKMGIPNIIYIPISALKGDNVVDRSENMPWYNGATLLYNLETVNAVSSGNYVDSRFPVQYVIRPQTEEFHDYRGYAGRVAGGVFKPGDSVTLLPTGFSTKIKSIDTIDGPVEEAFPPMSVCITLEDDLDLSRGDMIVKPDNQPNVGQDIEIMVTWLGDKPLQPRGKYILRHTTRECKAVVKEVKYKMNIHTLHREESDHDIQMNDIGRITLRTSVPLFFDNYKRNRDTGSVILIDEFTNNTVGAGVIIQ